MKIVTELESNESYYLIAPEGMNMTKILSAIFHNTGMKRGSFADQEVQRIFSYLFQNAEDLGYYYKTYYIEEYDSFREFLYQYKTLEYEFIDSFQLKEDETLWELKYYIDSYTIRSILGHDNVNLPLFNHFLEGIHL